MSVPTTPRRRPAIAAACGLAALLLTGGATPPAASAGTAGSAAAGAAAAAPAAGAGAFTWPLAPPVTVVRRFEPPPLPWLAGHRGVDLAGRPGTPVRAAGAGTVTFAGMVAGRPVVVVSHGALRTTYEPVHALVRPGAPVARGQWIGALASTGSHCGRTRPCLHWGLLRGTTYLNPLAQLGVGPVVLKPP